jgi:hypothetical protein
MERLPVRRSLPVWLRNLPSHAATSLAAKPENRDTSRQSRFIREPPGIRTELCAQRVHIVDADGEPWEALYTLEQQADGSLKITSCVLIKAGQDV